jgi:hypothetical protein
MSLERVNMEQKEESMSTLVKVVDEPPRRKAGRPKKGEIVAKKSKNRGTLGRPKGDKAIIDEYKARMLNSPKSAKVLETILNAALNDDHKNQAAAWKLVVDRIMPVSAFEQTKQGSGTPSISINITGLTSPVVNAEEVHYDIQDVEPKEDSDDES